MPELPVICGDDAVKALERLGFIVVRRESTHITLKKEGNRFVLTVPDHGRKPLKRGTLRSLIRTSGYTVAQFNDVL